MKRWSGGLKRKRRILARQGNKCWKCGCSLHLTKDEKKGSSKKAHIAHVVPRYISNDDSDSNLRLTCWPCEKKTKH